MDIGADVGFQKFADAQGGAIDGDAPLAGGDGGELRVFFIDRGPEGSEHGGGEVIEHDVAVGVGGHLPGMKHEGVAVLEDGDFGDGHFGERAQRQGRDRRRT